MAFKGHRVEPGMPLYKIADLSTIWVYADVYEYELPFVGVGQEARITLPYYPAEADRKSTRLNSSHLVISYAVFCLKKKNPLRTSPRLCPSRTAARRTRRPDTPRRTTACLDYRTCRTSHRQSVTLPRYPTGPRFRPH